MAADVLPSSRARPGFNPGAPATLRACTSLSMAGLDPAIQRARICGRNRFIGSQALACWMAAFARGSDGNATALGIIPGFFDHTHYG